MVKPRRSHQTESLESWNTEARLELLQDEEGFPVVPARFLGRLNVNGPDFSAVLSGSQVGTGAIVRVIETEPSRAWREGDPPLAHCRNKWCAFFGSSVHIDGNVLTVPMQLFRNLRRGTLNVSISDSSGLRTVLVRSTMNRAPSEHDKFLSSPGQPEPAK
jgi:hypothetical protein